MTSKKDHQLKRSRQFDVVEFAHLMGREYPKATAKDVDELLVLARRHGVAAVRVCNRGSDSDVARKDAVEARIEALCAGVGVRVKFGGDPRGYTVKVFFPSGRSNTWGGAEDGWGVPQ